MSIVFEQKKNAIILRSLICPHAEARQMQVLRKHVYTEDTGLLVCCCFYQSLSLSPSSFSPPVQFRNKAARPLTKRSLGKRCLAANFRALRINFPPRILVRMEREDPAGRRFPEKRALLTRRRTTASRGTTEQWITTDTEANLREAFPFSPTCAQRRCSLSC